MKPYEIVIRAILACLFGYLSLFHGLVLVQTGGTFTIIVTLLSALYLSAVFFLDFYNHHRTGDDRWKILTLLLVIPIFFVLILLLPYGFEYHHIYFHLFTLMLTLTVMQFIIAWLRKRFPTPDRLAEFEEELRSS